MALLAGLRLGGRLVASRLAPTAVLSERCFQSSALVQAANPPPKPVPLPKLKDSFLDGTSSTYLEELEERYRADPKSVDKTWASFFSSLGVDGCLRYAQSVRSCC